MSWKQHGGGKGRDMSKVSRGGKDQFDWDKIKMDKDRVQLCCVACVTLMYGDMIDRKTTLVIVS